MRPISVSVAVLLLLVVGLCAESGLGGYHSHKEWKRRHGVGGESTTGEEPSTGWRSHSAYKGRHRRPAALMAVETGKWWSDNMQLTEYQFDYTAQIATGYGPDVSDQRALTQLSAKVSIVLEHDNLATTRLQMFDIHMAQSHAVEVPAQELAFMADIDSPRATAELEQALALPLQFSYVGGRVGDIRFHVEDGDVKSRNVKRGLLQMLQLSSDGEAGLHLRREGSYTFTAEESTIEGLCPCLYSMTNPSGGPLVEVVKTIDYGKCTHKSTNGTSHKPIQAPMATTPIDRSTIYRYTIKWPSETSDDTDDTPPLPTQPLCVMARAELHSQYTTVPLLAGESPQMALVTSELVATGKFTVERHEHNNPPRFRTSPEQLGYDTSDEEIKELFYLHGDEKLNGTLRSTPFNSQVDRAEMGMALIKDIERELGVEADGEGIEAIRTMGSMNKLVQLLRRCTMLDLRRLSAAVKRDGSAKVKELFTNGLALARTRNTITALVAQLKSVEGEMPVGPIPDLMAVQLLTTMAVQKGSRHTSGSMADTVLQLCQSSTDFRKLSSPVGRACWLAFGAVVGSIERLDAEKEASYMEKLVERIDNAQSATDSVVALKAMGNAGLASSWRKLQKVAAGPSFLSMHAIEAMRRLPAETLWQVLAPMVLDQTRPNWLRAHAFAALMRKRQCTRGEGSNSSASHLDQVVGAVAMEESDEVKMFVREVLVAEAESPNCGSEVAHLRSLAKLLRPNPRRQSEVIAKFHKARYEPSEGNGAELETIALYPRPHLLTPMHASLSLNILGGGTKQCGVIEVSLCTHGMDNFLRESLLNATDSPPGGRAKGTLERALDKVKGWGGWGGSSAGAAPPKDAMALLSLRVNNIDINTVAIDSLIGGGSKNAESMGIKSLFGKMNPLKSSKKKDAGSNPLFQLPIGFTHDESVPSTLGAPIKISQWSWLVGGIASNFTKQKEISDRYQIAAFIDVNLLQSQRMETCPLAHTGCTGVGNHRSFEFNGPLQMEAKVEKGPVGHGSQLQLAMAVKLPMAKGIPTGANDTMPRGERISVVGNGLEDECEEELDLTVGTGRDGTLELPMRMHGHYHWPKGAPSWAKWTKMLSSTENHIHFDYDPAITTGRAAQRFQLTISASLFHHSAVSSTVAMGNSLANLTSMHQQLGRSSRFVNGEGAEQGEGENNSDDDSNSRERTRHQPSVSSQSSTFVRRAIDTQLAKISRRTAYRHSMRSALKVIGEGESHLAQWDAAWEAVCDSKLQACNTQFNLTNQHSPGAGDKWQVSSRVAALRSELSSPLDEDDVSGHYQRLMMAGRVELAQGNPNIDAGTVKHWLDVKVLGEPPLVTTDTIDPMLSRYQLSVDYNLPASIPYRARTALDAFKMANYWAVKTKYVPSADDANRQFLHAELSVDPVWKHYANLSIHTGNELTLLRGWTVPAWLADTLVVRLVGQEHSIHSVRQLLTPLLTHGSSSSNVGKIGQRHVCRINTAANGQLETFDGVVYNLPSVKSCNSVMLANCAGNASASANFSIQMRDVTVGSSAGGKERLQRKALKVVSRGQTIEIEPVVAKSGGAEKLRVHVNGQTTFESDSSNLASLPANIEFQQAVGAPSVDHPRQSQIPTGGRNEVVVVELEAQGLIVKFDGKAAKIYMTPRHPNTAAPGEACGLCMDYDRAYLSAAGGGQCGEEPIEGNSDQGSSVTVNDESKRKIVDPIRRSRMIEFSRKICFSVRPVETCPEGSYPLMTARSEEGNDGDEERAFLRRQKVAFACLSRESIESRRLRLIMRSKGIVHVNDFPVSFIQSVVVPEKCVHY